MKKTLIIVCLIFASSAALGAGALGIGFVADDFYMLSSGRFSKDTVYEEYVRPYLFNGTAGAGTDMKMYYMYRPVADLFFDAIGVLLGTDAFSYRVFAIFMYGLTTCFVFLFFKSIINDTKLAVMLGIVFQFLLSREQHLYFLTISGTSELSLLLWAATSYSYVMSVRSSNSKGINGLSIWLEPYYMLSIICAAFAAFSYESNGIHVLITVLLVRAFYGPLRGEAFSIDAKTLRETALAVMPFLIVFGVYFIMRSIELNALRISTGGALGNAFSIKITMLRVVKALPYVLIYSLPFAGYKARMFVLENFWATAGLAAATLLVALAFVLRRRHLTGRGYLIVDSRKAVFGFFAVFTLLNSFVAVFAPFPRSLVLPIIGVLGMILSLMRAKHYAAYAFTAFYALLSLSGFNAAVKDWTYAEDIGKKGYSEIARQTGDESKTYVLMTSIDHIGPYPVYSIRGNGFQNALKSNTGRQARLVVPVFMHYEDFGSYELSDVTCTPVGSSNDGTRYYRIIAMCEGCEIKVPDAQNDASVIDSGYAVISINSRTELNMLQSAQTYKDITIGIREGFEPLCIEFSSREIKS